MAIPDPLVGSPITALWGQEVADGLNGEGAFTNYTPVVTATTTNPGFGAGGSRLGRFAQIGDLVYVEVLCIFGPSGISAGSGTYGISLPAAPNGGLGITGNPGTVIGYGDVCCNGLFTSILVHLSPVGTMTMHYQDAAVNANQRSITDSQPGGWAVNDFIRFAATYEAA